MADTEAEKAKAEKLAAAKKKVRFPKIAPKDTLELD